MLKICALAAGDGPRFALLDQARAEIGLQIERILPKETGKGKLLLLGEIPGIRRCQNHCIGMIELPRINRVVRNRYSDRDQPSGSWRAAPVVYTWPLGRRRYLPREH